MHLKATLAFASLLLCSQHASACSAPAVIDQLTSIETQKLLSNAPTFKQAWQDQAIRFQFKNARAEGSTCTASLEIHLPQADLNEANQYLDQNPAKRILIAAQGYAIPEQTTTEVPFNFQILDGKVSASDPNAPEVKALHNNIEYTYQLLAQLRVSVDELNNNKTPWNNEEIKVANDNCNNSKMSQGTSFCACRIDQVSKVISAKQMELIRYIETQPFSVATGSLDSFHKFSEKVDASCTAQR
jgi:hypothetical protein